MSKRTNNANTSVATVAPVSPVPAPVAVSPGPGKTGLKIQKVRPTANGVTAPSTGGKCAAVWDHCSAHLAQHGAKPTVAQVRAWAGEQGCNVNNAQIEYYAWCKHNGLSRTQLAQAAKVATASA